MLEETRKLDEKLLAICEYELKKAQSIFEKAYWQKAVDDWKKRLKF